MAEKTYSPGEGFFEIRTHDEIFKCRIRWGGIDLSKTLISGVLEVNGEEVEGMYMSWNYSKYPNGMPGVFWTEKSDASLRSRLVRDLNIQKAVKTYFQLKLNEISGKAVQQQAAQEEPKKADDVVNDAATILAGVIDFGDEEILYDEEPVVCLPTVGKCNSDDPKVIVANSKQAITKAEKAGCNAQLISRLRNGLSAGKISEVFIENNIVKVLCGDRLFYGDPVTGEVKKFG